MPRAWTGMPIFAVDLFDESVRRKEERLVDYLARTSAQQAWAEIDAPQKCWMDGNAVGKSHGMAADLIQVILGVHPTIRRPGPIKALVIGTSYEQMVPLMEKLWQLAPKADLDPSCGFEPGRGITGKPPRLVFVRGRGKGSEILFATYRAGAARVAGGQYDIVILDEPPPESMYGEIRPRLLRKRGLLWIGFTPVPDMPDVTYLLEKMDKGSIVKHNVGLHEAACWPAGYPAPWHWQYEIDEYADELLVTERRMRINGDPTPVVTDQLIRAFDESIHEVDLDLRDLVGWSLTVGTDHGTSDKKQASMLVATLGEHTDRPQVAWVDEAVQKDGYTTPEEDASAVVDMLQRNNLTPDDIDWWAGDVPTSTRTGDIRKSNRQLRKEVIRVCKARKIPVQRTFSIDEPVKGPGSMTMGVRAINTMFRRRNDDGTPCARIARGRVPAFKQAIQRFNGDTHHPDKDVLDAGRYGFERATGKSVLRVLTARY